MLLVCSYKVKAEEVDPETGEPLTYWITNVYDPVTFLIKFYSYDIPNLEGTTFPTWKVLEGGDRQGTCQQAAGNVTFNAFLIFLLTAWHCAIHTQCLLNDMLKGLNRRNVTLHGATLS